LESPQDQIQALIKPKKREKNGFHWEKFLDFWVKVYVFFGLGFECEPAQPKSHVFLLGTNVSKKFEGAN
jgi:hypothetical protein